MLPRENGEIVPMQLPEIISASRSTDIPAFYADWFFHRLEAGYSAWTNPFNGVRGYVSYRNTRFIVFWSKNPRPLLRHLDYLEKRKINCYIQYSLNDYEQEGLEPSVPPLEERIETFRLLAERLGKGRVIWRFDPLVLTSGLDADMLLSRVEHIGDALSGYTEKLVFSYADIGVYKKVAANLRNGHIPYLEWTEPEMREFARKLSTLNNGRWGYELSTCAESPGLKLSDFGISPGHCIDDRLMIRFAYNDEVLMKALKVRIVPPPTANVFGEVENIPANAVRLPDGRYAIPGDNSDKGQRLYCGCMRSKDIGEYNTCMHFCKYCYANAGRERVLANASMHRENPYGETITGR